MWSNISVPRIGTKALWAGVDQENKHQFPPLMRFKHAVCSSMTTGHIYIHGGRFANGVPLDDDLWRFDARENSWLQLETRGCRPPSLQEHTLVELDGQLYLFGGQVSAASGQENFFWRLDLASNQWTCLNKRGSIRSGCYLGPTNRRGHSACLYRSSIFVFGGFEDFRGSSNQLWQYDSLTERWQLCNLSASASSSSQPDARHSHSAVWYQDSMYIYGGLCNLKPLGDLWRYSWRDQRWSKEKTRGQGPGPLHGHSACLAFDSMFVFGGERQSGRTTRSLWRLDLSNLCWHKIKTKGPQPGAITWHAAVGNPLSVLDDEANYQMGELTFGHSTLGNAYEMQPLQELPRQIDPAWSKLCGSSLEQQIVSANSRLACKPPKRRRRLKLDFLRRVKNQGGGDFAPSSESEANKEEAVAEVEQDVEMSADLASPKARGNQTHDSQVCILDRLGREIQAMFEGSLSPQDGQQAARGPDSVQRMPAIARDSLTQSQLSSYLAQTSTQTYQTAREHLTSQSTLQDDSRAGPILFANPTKLADVRQRRSMYQFKQQIANSLQNSAAGSRGGRPKSETVQSLIDKADARIKHLYTPHFNHTNQQRINQRQRSSTGSKVSPMLYQLPWHSTRRSVSGEQTSTGDKSKRHTIQHTRAYYSLYFGDHFDAPDGRESRLESPSYKPMQLRGTFASLQRDNSVGSSRASIMTIVNEGDDDASQKGRVESNNSTTAALDGVNLTDGNSSSSSSARLVSEVASLVQSSESHTLCNKSDADEYHDDKHQIISQPNSHSSGSPISQLLNVQYQGPTGGRRGSESDDNNTSMSISMITELEEDDMLQCSISEQREEVSSARQASCVSEIEIELEGKSHDSQEEAKLARPIGESTSSGYDSFRRQASDAATSRSGGREGIRCAAVNSTTIDSLTSTNNGSPLKCVPSSPATAASFRGSRLDNLVSSQDDGGKRQSFASKLIFGRRQTKIRYWQLCMFVLGGKQQGGGRHHGGTVNANEPITVWRLYI